jgi:uncharacterized protein with HEPN domain
MKKLVGPHIGAALDSLQVVIDRLPEGKELFLQDPVLKDATLLMRLQAAGEQLARVRDSFPEEYENYHTDACAKLIGLRNIISHGYTQVDMDRVWQIVSDDLPPLINELHKIV